MPAMRIVVMILLLANLAFLAWANWIDRPAPLRPATVTTAALPRLVLAAESAKDIAAESARQAKPRIAEAVLAPLPEGTERCVTVGPFNDLATSARAAALLRERGLEPRQRTEEGERWEGYWVYIGGLNTVADEARVLLELQNNGIRDAHSMPASEQGRRVSVGLFTEREGAERRAGAVRRLGFEPQIVERRQPGTVYWVDLTLTSQNQTVPSEGLTGMGRGRTLEIKPCPVRTGSAEPGSRAANIG